MTDRVLAPTRTRYYAVRMPGTSVWARIWITDDGCFSTVSDHGNYGYWWGCPGCEFRKFLTGIDSSYLIRKLAAGEHELNEQRTVDAVKELILRQRRSRSITADRAADEWRRLRATDFNDEVSRSDWYLHTSLEDAHEVLRYEPPMQVRMFAKCLWPIFVEQLKAELAAEAAAGTTPELG